jgi:hypothetical protein
MYGCPYIGFGYFSNHEYWCSAHSLEDDSIRVCAPRRSYSYMLATLDSIRRYGASDLNVCRRALRLFGDLGSILTQLKRMEAIPTILVQLEQWMVAARNKFPEGSPALVSLYNHILRTIAESKNVVMCAGSGVKDLQDYETTYDSAQHVSESERGQVEIWFKIFCGKSNFRASKQSLPCVGCYH